MRGAAAKRKPPVKEISRPTNLFCITPRFNRPERALAPVLPAFWHI
jgi:hypothetical protein